MVRQLTPTCNGPSIMGRPLTPTCNDKSAMFTANGNAAESLSDMDELALDELQLEYKAFLASEAQRASSRDALAKSTPAKMSTPRRNPPRSKRYSSKRAFEDELQPVRSTRKRAKLALPTPSPSTRRASESSDEIVVCVNHGPVAAKGMMTIKYPPSFNSIFIQKVRDSAPETKVTESPSSLDLTLQHESQVRANDTPLTEGPPASNRASQGDDNRVIRVSPLKPRTTKLRITVQKTKVSDCSLPLAFALQRENHVNAQETQVSERQLPLKLTCCHDRNEQTRKCLVRIKPLVLLLSKLLCTRGPAYLSSCQPSGVPQVWADSRQALYETLPQFQKPQGGCHQNDGQVYSFLFDGDSHHREYLDDEVIIARTTGGMEQAQDKSYVQSKHQGMDESNPKALLNNMAFQNPIIVICGNRHTGAHVRVPHRYCVLGWYKPVAIWAEKSLGRGRECWTTIKVRLERLGCGTPAWHTPQGNSFQHCREMASRLPATERTCTACQKPSPQVYVELWTCLHADCSRFWLTDANKPAPGGDLNFHPAFLAQRTPWEIEQEPFDIRITLPNVDVAIGDNVTYINTRGVICPQCGRCNSRYLFHKWQCDNPNCTWPGLEPARRALPLPALHLPWGNIGHGPSLVRNKHGKGVNLRVTYRDGYKVCTYTFDGMEGCLVHAIANATVNSGPQGANAMFEAFQVTDMKLERRRFNHQIGAKVKPPPKKRPRSSKKQTPSSTKQAPSSMMTTSSIDSGIETRAEADQESSLPSESTPQNGDFMITFCANYGEPYKFAAQGSTHEFETAAWPISAGLSKLNNARRQFLDEKTEGNDFNELLAIAYMEKQKMEYHDDGEQGLGPCVASLSLGCKAQMALRLKAKHYVGCSKNGVLTPDRPLPFCLGGRQAFEKRMDAWKKLQLLEGPDSSTKPLSPAKDLGLCKSKSKNSPDLVTLTLSHGDIMIMNGREMQHYLEHRVASDGMLRFSMTCREILPSHSGGK